MTNRRKFIMLLGGGAVLAAGGAGTFLATRDPAAARVPWAKAGEASDDPRRFALSYAVLAPNPHNRQPWLADLGEPGFVTLYCQQDRRLPATDPYDRQITIGLGCFLEILSMAAAEIGYRTEISLFPEGAPDQRLDSRPVARIGFAEDPMAKKDPLFAQVTERRSNKEPFDMGRSLPDDVLASIGAAARTGTVNHTSATDRVSELRELGWQAMRTELYTPAAYKESIDLMRIGKAEIEANPDGIDLGGAFFEALKAVGMLSRDQLLDTSSQAFQQGLSSLKEPFDTAMAFMWLVTKGNRRTDQITVGRDHVRLNLAATAAGVSMHPLSQALQEYDEMRDHFQAIRTKLEIAGDETLQMFCRLGYGPRVAAAPRWPYETRIRNA